MTWSDIFSGSIYLTSSQDGGSTFTQPIRIVSATPVPYNFPGDKFRVFTYPSMGVDQKTGNMYVAWADYRNQDADIYSNAPRMMASHGTGRSELTMISSGTARTSSCLGSLSRLMGLFT